MCGIGGIVALRSEPVPKEALRRMNATIRHRGPDDEGYYCEDSDIGLAMRRLSIIDRQGGHQPIHNEDHSIWVIFNGEIYNHRELRSLLQASGHQFYTASDTEVLVHLYEKYGYCFVEHLRGMFAFAIYDRTKRSLVLGRDRSGQKPLYYAVTQDYLIFSSEIKAIHASLLVSKGLDVYALDSYLSHGFVAGARTMFEGVQKLPAGCVLVLHNNDIEVKRYWDLPRVKSFSISEQEASSRLRGLIEEAVRIRLMSEVPLGVFLSGGIDSSAVVGLMARHLSSPIKTFSVGFGDSKIDELDHARAVARHFGTDHHEHVITSCTPDLLKYINWHHDEPAADPAIVPTFLLSKFARQTVTVALTGEGGDEIFCGYNHYQIYYKLLQFERRFFKLNRLAHGAEYFPQIANHFGNRRLWKGIWIAGLAPEERPRGWLSIFTDYEKQLLCRREFLEKLTEESTRTICAEYQEQVRNHDAISQSMYVDSKLQLADQLLMKVDKMSMASSLEARCPLLDHKLVEFVSTLPIEMKISRFGSKLILRKSLNDLIPKEILERPKQGFEVPIRKWLQHDLKDCVHDSLLKSSGAVFDYLDYRFVQSLWTDFSRSGDQLVARQLWLLLNFVIWYEAHWN